MYNSNNIFIMRMGVVVSIDDDTDSGRIRVKILSSDNGKKNEEIPYAFPLLPKVYHVKPKIGECVLVTSMKLDNMYEQRFYIGPIIGQFQDLNETLYVDLNIENKTITGRHESMVMDADSEGTFPKNDEVALLSRKNSDIILGDNDLKIRCGSRKMKDGYNEKLHFNRKDPAYILLKYKNEENDNNGRSSVNIVGDNINILSHKSLNDYNLTDKNDLITDEELNRIIESAHELPYGDKLVEFLKIFVTAFKKHTHPYAGLPPCTDSSFKALDEYNLRDILSEHIKIN